MKQIKLSEEQINFIITNYPIMGCVKLSKLLCVSENTITNIKQKMNLKFTRDKKTDVDVKIFEQCITPEAAYVLGILWADGNVTNYKITIECVFDDVILFKKWFDKTGLWGFSNRVRPNRREQGTLTVHSKKLADFFNDNDYHIKSKISPTKILSKIPENLKKYFFLGWFDGDGCFYFNKKYGLRQFVVAGAYEQDWSEIENFCSSLNIEYKISKITTNHGNSSIVRIINRNNIKKIGEYIYDNYDTNNIGLKRKYDKYLEIIHQKIKIS
jgi:hypothetical protein